MLKEVSCGDVQCDGEYGKSIQESDSFKPYIVVNNEYIQTICTDLEISLEYELLLCFKVIKRITRETNGEICWNHKIYRLTHCFPLKL